MKRSTRRAALALSALLAATGALTGCSANAGSGMIDAFEAHMQ